MNHLGERILFLAIGGVMGFVLGYIVRSITCLRNDVEEIKHHSHPKDAGLSRKPVILDVVLLFVVCLTVFASFQSQKASNRVSDSQARIERVSACTLTFLSKTITALNDRTTYTGEQADKNIELQKAQARYLNFVVHKPPPSMHEALKAFRQYLSALTNFITVSEKNHDAITTNPYPTSLELQRCLNGET